MVIFGASHGFMKDGRQNLCMREFNARENYFDLIPVELYVRSTSRDFPNIYNLVHYACCREIFNGFKHKLIKNLLQD